MRAHMAGSWDIPNMDCESGKSKWLAKGKLEEMPHKSNSNALRAILSLSESTCVSIHVYCSLFFLLIKTLLISLLSIFVGILFCKAKEPGPCHWPLVYWLGFSAFTTVTRPQTLVSTKAAAGPGLLKIRTCILNTEILLRELTSLIKKDNLFF